MVMSNPHGSCFKFDRLPIQFKGFHSGLSDIMYIRIINFTCFNKVILKLSIIASNIRLICRHLCFMKL